MAKTYEELLQNNLNFFKQRIEKSNITDSKTGQKVTVDYNTVNGKVLYAFINTLTNAEYNNNKNDEYLFKQFFPQTSNYNTLKEFHGNTWGVLPYTATPATGYVIFTGTEGASIMQGTEINTNGQNYSTERTVVISRNTIKVKSLTASQSKATVILAQDFKTASGMTIAKIYGANEEQFNKENFKITTISTDSFTYEVSSEAPNTATGDIFVDIISASVMVTSNNKGENQNLINGTQLSLNIPKADVDDNCYVYYDGITGGKNAESEEDFRSRVINRIRGIPQGWNRSNIIITIQNFQYGRYSDALYFIPRAEKTDGTKQSGYSTIYMLKKDLSVLSTTESNDIKKYLEETIYKINPTEDQVNVVSPVLKQVPISISLLNNANTLDMRKAVEETIKDMQKDTTVCFFRKEILRKTIISWLDQVIDPSGNVLEDNYILNKPLENVALEYNEFPILQLEWE